MAPKKRRVEFSILAPEAQQVLLSGTFNKWSDKSDPMKKDHTGTWKKIKLLPPGTYEYKFIVDGVWALDPNCPSTVPNQYGTQNNLFELPEAAASGKTKTSPRRSRGSSPATTKTRK